MVDNPNCSEALTDFLNTYSKLGEKEIRFAELGDKNGIAIFPASAAVVIQERTDVCGGVYQRCGYAFHIIYRSTPRAERERLAVKAFLDDLSVWLEQCPDDDFPIIGGNREIKSFSRQSAAVLSRRYDDGVEDWAVVMQMQYTNTFTR